MNCFILGNIPNLVARSKQCLGALQATDQVIPRQEIIEYCTVFLLNMAEWDYLTSLEKRWSYTEFAAAISSVCQDIVKYKGTRKFPREAWDMSKYFIVNQFKLLYFTCFCFFFLWKYK